MTETRPGKEIAPENSGREGGGESGGGAYDNPHSGKHPKQGGFTGHGGQTEIDYHGPSDDEANADRNENAVTGTRPTPD